MKAHKKAPKSLPFTWPIIIISERFYSYINPINKGKHLRPEEEAGNRQDGRRHRAGLFHFIFFISALFVMLSAETSCAADVYARAAVVIDDKEEILYAKNPDLKLPPASTTKLITAMVALDKLNPDSMVTVSRKAADTPSVQPHLRAGDNISVRDLLNFALIRSINGAAIALAESAAGSENSFVPLMNEKALSVGALNTRFINASGLPGKGQHTTARDLARIMKKALSYPLIAEIIDTKVKALDVDGKTILLTNTNNLLWDDDDHLGGKTGYTRAARHCFVGASSKEEGVIIIALLGDSSRNTLWTDAEKLLAKDFEKGTIIITDQKSYKVKPRRVNRSRTRRSRTKSL
ncbi:MAG: D-alanyl-D-alanine carboxypeptidase [Nitrospiraceae bacterium]|nr:MAG: D-alanyl-D-alanine carboxypeptidase [Nitrospiraceae bacterium]